MPANGDYVRDKISGFEGTVICESNWLYGCKRLTVQPPVDGDGKMRDAASFDEPQLEVIRKAGKLSNNDDPGGPRPEPTRR